MRLVNGADALAPVPTVTVYSVTHLAPLPIAKLLSPPLRLTVASLPIVTVTI
ncbi:hypothetical protein LAV73_06465 [Lysinibacillus xylanilyticus]|uniref:hypothetical protein n=1 Tax=Lysinibacillus xylanilyticus TaxID=582475 RepID=UPI002B2556B6|nr:hypothetical protein [Lysinibacillus xylanilyticus]MEB2279644.1 hypothetical protein [Lysinibacillus xylanilyticus]